MGDAAEEAEETEMKANGDHHGIYRAGREDRSQP